MEICVVTKVSIDILKKLHVRTSVYSGYEDARAAVEKEVDWYSRLFRVSCTSDGDVWNMCKWNRKVKVFNAWKISRHVLNEETS